MNKHIHIQDVPRRTLEDVVLSVSEGLEKCRLAIVDVSEANEHNALTKDELTERLGDIGFSFYDGVFHIFAHFGFVAKSEEVGNE